jgi:RNA polymerase sigma factor (sigma-70 family)
MIATALSDAELLAQARRGDEAAFTELYVRHQAAARRVAASYGRAGDPDDLVNESFERVLKAIKRGAGPEDAFRAYLFVTLRRIAADRIAKMRDEPVEEVPEPVRAEERAEPVDPDERQLVVTAFESLPERWQAVLWQTAVEGRQPRELAPTLGMSANAAAALAYRAREKLRQAYLQAHLQAAPRPQCEPHRSRLGAYVRDGLSRRDKGATDTHLEDCSSCRGLVAELADINRLLVRSLLPVFTSVAGTTAVVAGGGAVAGGVLVRMWTKAKNPAFAAGFVLAAVLTAAMVAMRSGPDAVLPDAASPAPPGEASAAPAPPSPDTPPPPATQALTTPPDDPSPTGGPAAPSSTTARPPSSTTPSAPQAHPPSTPPNTDPPPTTGPPPPTTPDPPPEGPIVDVEAGLDLTLLGLDLGLFLDVELWGP